MSRFTVVVEGTEVNVKELAHALRHDPEAFSEMLSDMTNGGGSPTRMGIQQGLALQNVHRYLQQMVYHMLMGMVIGFQYQAHTDPRNAAAVKDCIHLTAAMREGEFLGAPLFIDSDITWDRVMTEELDKYRKRVVP